MKLILLLVSTIGYISLIRVTLGVRFPVAQFLYISLVVIFLYAFGLFGFLQAGVILITLVGLCAFSFTLANSVKRILALLRAPRNADEVILQGYSLMRNVDGSVKTVLRFFLLQIHQLKNTGWSFLYIVPFVVLYNTISDEYLFTGWDEFSHWALSIKIIYESNLFSQ